MGVVILMFGLQTFDWDNFRNFFNKKQLLYILLSSYLDNLYFGIIIIVETYKILILEDDFEAVSKIMAELFLLEGHFAPYDFDITVLSTYESVEKLINPQDKEAYDVILLDRDCKLCGSFHILDIEKFGPEKIISISSTPNWNNKAMTRGVTRVVPKSFSDLDGFAKRLSREIKYLLKTKNLEKSKNLVSFLEGSSLDYKGRHIEQIFEMADDELETTHDYIQLLVIRTRM